jgi:TPR repeat protein
MLVFLIHIPLLFIGAVGCGVLSASGATKLHEEQCEAGDSAKCLYLGARLVRGEGVPSDPARGRELLGRACDQGQTQACAMLADLLEQGAGGPADSSAALERYAKACKAGHEDSCAKVKQSQTPSDELSPNQQVDWCGKGKVAQCLGLGAAWLLSAESQSATANASTYLDKACQAGAATGCVMSCELLVRGKGEGACAAACEEKNPDACLALAKSSEGSARRAWQDKACRAGHGQTCFELQGAIEGEDNEAAREELLLAGCAGGSAQSCAQLGWSKAIAGEGGATALLTSACDLGDPESCLLSNLPPSEAKDAALNKACSARKADSCAVLAVRQFSKGQSGWNKALARAEQSCRLEPGPVCLMAASLTVRLAGPKTSSVKAGKLAQAGCDAGHGASCRYLAKLSPKEKLRALLDKACEAQDVLSCLGSANSWLSDADGSRDGLRAMAGIAKACELKAPEACLRHAELLAELAHDSSSEQISSLDAACSLGEPRGCRALAQRSLEGTTNLDSARRHAFLGCDKGDAESCRIAGDLLLEGRGGAKDIAKAKAMYEKACDAALAMACIERGKLR